MTSVQTNSKKRGREEETAEKESKKVAQEVRSVEKPLDLTNDFEYLLAWVNEIHSTRVKSEVHSEIRSGNFPGFLTFCVSVSVRSALEVSMWKFTEELRMQEHRSNGPLNTGQMWLIFIAMLDLGYDREYLRYFYGF